MSLGPDLGLKACRRLKAPQVRLYNLDVGHFPKKKVDNIGNLPPKTHFNLDIRADKGVWPRLEGRRPRPT